MGETGKGAAAQAPRAKPRREILWDEYDELMRQLAVAVAQKAIPDAVVGIARGGAIVGCNLSFLLGKEYFPIRLKKQGGATRVVVPPPPDVAGMHVALVDDLSQSGDTFKIAQLELKRAGVKKITTVALVRRDPGFKPDVWALEVTSKVRFPWARHQLVDGKFIRR